MCCFFSKQQDLLMWLVFKLQCQDPLSPQKPGFAAPLPAVRGGSRCCFSARHGLVRGRGAAACGAQHPRRAAASPLAWKWPHGEERSTRAGDARTRRGRCSGAEGLPEGWVPVVLRPPAQAVPATPGPAEPSWARGCAVPPLGRTGSATSRRLPAKSPGSIFAPWCRRCRSPSSAGFPQNCVLLSARAFPVTEGGVFLLACVR